MGRTWLAALSLLLVVGCRGVGAAGRSEEHTSELQSQSNLVCRLLLEKKTRTARLPKVFVRFIRFPLNFAHVLTERYNGITSQIRYGVIPAERSESRAPTRHACCVEMGPGSALRAVRGDMEFCNSSS